MKLDHLDFSSQIDIMQQHLTTWKILKQYDENFIFQSESLDFVEAEDVFDVVDARSAINDFLVMLQNNHLASDYFGKEKNGTLQAILGNLNQSFGGQLVYSSSLERAAHLLYFVIKDHPFVDGNKRIGCLLFLLYLKKANISSININSSGLAAIAVLISESSPLQKKQMISLVMSLIDISHL